jgi:hypothetical protein
VVVTVVVTVAGIRAVGWAVELIQLVTSVGVVVGLVGMAVAVAVVLGMVLAVALAAAVTVARRRTVCVSVLPPPRHYTRID